LNASIEAASRRLSGVVGGRGDGDQGFGLREQELQAEKAPLKMLSVGNDDELSDAFALDETR
jgi:hypothetical protein